MKLLLRPHSLPLIAFSPKFTLPHKLLLPIYFTSSFSSATIQSLSQFSDQSFSYGPSLFKGTCPFGVFRQPPTDHSQPILKPVTENPERERLRNHENEEQGVFNEDIFTRIFDIAALRVPAKVCFELENRLRGHLLNWPRVRNIARVPGDEVEPELVELVGEQNWDNSEDSDGFVIDSLHRRIYGKSESDGDPLSPVLYREKLMKTFDSKGYVKFRHLAKMSRPKKKRVKKEQSGDGRRSTGRNEFTSVEVVDCGDHEMEDMKGLLGDGFKSGKWRGSTRLLLLDEQYAGKVAAELPESIKALLKEFTKQSMGSAVELVRCRLTLFYDYWPMNEVLEALLPKDMIIPSAFETVGHIAHLNLRDEHLPYKSLIAKVVLDKNKPKIQTVVNKIDVINNDYRTMQLEVLAGNHSLVTTVVENGLKFHLDLATVYWNSRLATERQRLISGFTCRDVVCDVFAGVGPISISAAKIVKKVYANDLNPYSVEYLERNSVVNKLERKIEVFNMDGRRFISAMFASEKAQKITQIVMNLPKDAAEYLDAFKGILKDRPADREFTLPTIHVYGFSKAGDPEFDFHERIRIALSEVAVDVNMRRVRLVAPGKWMLYASFRLPETVAFSKHGFDM